eukprot:7627580-Alexandrium_andersonii.AAC.1
MSSRPILEPQSAAIRPTEAPVSRTGPCRAPQAGRTGSKAGWQRIGTPRFGGSQEGVNKRES